MVIRDALPGDWSDIWPFCHKIIAAGETYAWDPELGSDAARERWMSPSARVFVVEDCGRIVASAYLKPNYGGPAAHMANVGLMVDPACARRGIGRRLANHVVDQARRSGYRGVVLNAVVETNPATALWLSLGFEIVGTIPEAYDHPLHGSVGLHVMYRKL